MRASAVVNWGSTWRELAWTGTPSLPRCSTPPIAWWPLGGGQVERGADVVTHADPYDHLWARLGRHLPWITTQQVSTHWLRHTTLTWVERHHGYAVARAYAGHDGGRDIGVTATMSAPTSPRSPQRWPRSPVNRIRSPPMPMAWARRRAPAARPRA